MNIGKFIEYRGCIGTIEYEDGKHFGKLIKFPRPHGKDKYKRNDLVTYSADSLADLFDEYKAAVDDYVEMLMQEALI